MNTSAKKGFAFTPRKRTPLLQKKCKTIFWKTLIANTGINYTKKKKLEIKFITKIFVKSIL